jgi:hypothetical protein
MQQVFSTWRSQTHDGSFVGSDVKTHSPVAGSHVSSVHTSLSLHVGVTVSSFTH